ncbi:hypothetical protein CHLRE_17g699975v5 [Chlamydomonas reinhardtii]|uniref:Uncharacterized protein n=1 Tax=Chlamydomonas reinhardtii TaxID=3055 RepID=A0A2K3CNW0_CHLRE|nr:uncharacterized protein CHLRE_17g699975v5 [Chlamydomonas reinhardtii]PNW69965.1 hypothetical protein CHLRE_17g699975v5 [Chlamydomonas reinhardtii]
MAPMPSAPPVPEAQRPDLLSTATFQAPQPPQLPPPPQPPPPQPPPPPRLLGFSDHLYDSLLRPAVEAAEAQWVAGGDRSLFRRHRGLQLEARRQQRHQQLRARQQAQQGQQAQGLGQEHGLQQQPTRQAGQPGQPGQEGGTRTAGASWHQHPHQYPHPHLHSDQQRHQVSGGGLLPPYPPPPQPPPPPLLRDWQQQQQHHHHHHVPTEIPTATARPPTLPVSGFHAFGAAPAAPPHTLAGGGLPARAAAAGPHLPQVLAPWHPTASTATTDDSSPSHQHDDHNYTPQLHPHKHQHQRHQHQHSQQQQPEGGEMLEKLRLVLSYEYDMPLEDVRPDLDLGQLRRPAAAAGVAGAVVVGDGAHDDDDQSGQQAVVDCVERSFEMFLQLGGG